MSEDPIEVIELSDNEDPDPNEFTETDQQINTSYMENSMEIKNKTKRSATTKTNPSSPSKTQN